MPLPDNTYKCALCGNVYEKGWTDEEAAKEAKEVMGIEDVNDKRNVAIVCDDCYKKVTTIHN